MKPAHLHPVFSPSRAGWRWVAGTILLFGAVLTCGTAEAITTPIDDFTQVEAPSPWTAGTPENHDGIPGLDLTLQLTSSNPIPPNNNPVLVFPYAYDESGLNPANVIGGTRRSELSVTASTPPPQEFEIALINVLPAGTGVFSFETGLTVIAHTSLIYNAVLPAGASNGTALVTFNNYDFETEEPLLVRLDIVGGGAGFIERELNQVVNIDSPFDLALPLGLGEFAGVNFGGPVSLKFTFFGNTADDFGLEQIVLETRDTPNVPEPSSVALAALGLVGLAGYGLTRRRHRGNTQRKDSIAPANTEIPGSDVLPRDVTSTSLLSHTICLQHPGPTAKKEANAMSHLKHLLLGLTAAAAVALSQTPAEALTIDTFDDNPAPALNLSVAVGDAPASNTQSPVTGTVSNNRKATLTVMSGDDEAEATMRIIGPAVNRRVSLNSEDSVVAKWNLDYVPLSSIDVTNGGIGTGIQVHFYSAEHSTAVTVSLDVPGAGSPLKQTINKAAGPEIVFFDFDNFLDSFAVITPVTSATLVNGIHIEVLGVNNGDYSIELIDTRQQAVPEPSTLVLAGLGLVGLAAWGWRRSKFARGRC